MNLRDLEYLVAVADLRHFRKAADHCHISQPTLSGQLKKLEEYLGVQLIERTRRSVLTTEVGKEIVARARIILREVNEIERIAETFTDPMSGKILVGLIPTLAPYLLPLISKPIKQRFPRLTLLLLEEQTETLTERLEKGALDLAILALSIEGPYFEEIELFEEQFLVACAREHPLAKKKTVRRSDLENERVLLLEDGHCLRGQALDVCFAAGAREAGDFRATSLETLRHMVGTGNGITLIPELAARPEITRPGGPIRYIPFSRPAPSRRVGLLFRKNSGRKACFQELARLIRTIMQDEGPKHQSK